MLYSHTVIFCDVYPLHDDAGNRLSAPAVLDGRKRGWLRMWRPRTGPPIRYASVVDEREKEVVTGLTCVEVVRIERGGILLVGFLDEGRSSAAVRQRWWCVPQQRPA